MAGPEDLPKMNALGELQSNNYFERLGLRNGASDREIKDAFRRLAKDFHPDINPGDPSAEGKFKLINEAYEYLMQGISSVEAAARAQRGYHQPPRERKQRSPENEATRKRFEELKTEALGVESFEEGRALAETIAGEFEKGDRRSDLLWFLTRRLHRILQSRIKSHTTLESLATLAAEVNTFCDSPAGRLLHTAFFTDELDATALEIGLAMLEKANVKKDVDNALAAIARYPATFGAIIEMPVANSKQDTMDKIKFLRRIKTGRPRTGERLDKLIAQVNEHRFLDEKRGDSYKKQIIDVIERHRKIYYRNGEFVPLQMSPEEGGNE